MADRLRAAAWAAVVLHLVAGLAMLFVLRHGLETNPDLTGRMIFVGAYPSWKAAWLTWTAAALSILYFMHAFSEAHAVPAARLAALLTAAAVPLDLAAQCLEIGALPELAAAHRSRDFLIVHRAAVLLTGFGANALYTLAAGSAAWAGRGAYPAWTTRAGYGVLAAGLAASAAALADSAPGMFWTNAVLVPLLLAWLGGVALARTNVLVNAAAPGASK